MIHRAFSYVPDKARRTLQRVRRRFYPSQRELDYARWFANEGDKTVRLDYALGPESIVFDVGGFEGQWASDIFARYCCVVHVFEPVPKYAQAIETRFVGNPRIHVHGFGLAGRTREEQIAIIGDGSSIFARGDEHMSIKLKSAREFCDQAGFEQLDLMKINIEGGEYELLEHLLETGAVARVRHFQIQFHDFVPDARQRMERIQQQLGRTHRLCWQYPFIWEGWSRIG